MKPIIVNETNRCKIDALILGVEGRATARTIDFSDIVWACKQIEKELGIPKKYLEGVRFDVDPHAQDFPNAYRFRPESTQFLIGFSGGKWRLSGIERYYTRAEGHKYKCVEMPEEVKQRILNRFMEF